MGVGCLVSKRYLALDLVGKPSSVAFLLASNTKAINMAKTYFYEQVMSDKKPLPQQLTELRHLLTQGQLQSALTKAEQLQQQHPQYTALMWILVELYQYANLPKLQRQQLEQLTNLLPQEPKGWLALATVLYRLGHGQQALTAINKAQLLTPKNPVIYTYKGLICRELNQYQEAIEAFKYVISLGKADFATHNSLGLLYQSVGLFDKAELQYKKSISLGGRRHPLGYNNLIQLQHYRPDSSADNIYNLITRWPDKFARNLKAMSLSNKALDADRCLKIGLVSQGFNTHPVGQMITKILELLPKHEITLLAYSTQLKEDTITKRIKHTVQTFRTIDHLNEIQLAEQITADSIDILFDLSGHMNGCRMRTMAMKPAPILVKWVGGLINTTGLSTMDYLLSDGIETPAGVDEWYTEKLIRMPHDYVCYEAPAYSHDVYSPPVTHNGYITLGCFNNPQKINHLVLEQWANIMHQLPNSRLFLKSFQFNSSILVDNVTNTMAEFGITAERLIIEGPSGHSDLLKAYNKVDIALDPWPYSGGLTTCEAMFMGVPVVTYPGPTFAGRHSATHLTNAGLGQLVANSWEEYCERVVNLANDPENLTNIRKYLRSALLESPVCDAANFARHFANAMRAIWQRHCEGLPPAALTLDAAGQCQFADETMPVQLQLPTEPQQLTDTADDNSSFSFNFTGLITALDHGASLASHSNFRNFLRKGGVNYICLDPGVVVRNAQQLQHTGLFHHFPLMVLGDGSNMDLRLAVQAELSSSLPVLSEQSDVTPSIKPPTLVSTTPVTSNRIDDINGIDNIDWLILDAQHHNLSILEHGSQKLADALLIEVAVSFAPHYKEQVGLDVIQQLLTNAGFELLKLDNVPQARSTAEHDKVTFGKALFILNEQALSQLDNNQLMKLAFLLDSAYSLKESAYQLLSKVDEAQAKLYLQRKPTQTNNESSGFELPTSPAMTSDEQQLFLSKLKQAKNYFEFGSGGSTVWAVQQGLTVQGVESDPAWVQALQEKLGQQCQVAVVDIGPTGDWGYPLTTQTDKFPRYSQAILEHEHAFDLILIDGRFRVACTMATIQHIAKHHTQDSTIIFIHDFWNRPQYHCVLEFLDVVEQVESAGVFKVKKDVSLDSVAEIWLEYSVKAE